MKIKSMTSYLLPLYLMAIGCLFIMAFIGLNETYFHIERGYFGRQQSLLDDLISSLAAEEGPASLEKQNAHKQLARTVIPLTSRSFARITALAAYERMALLLGALCYLFSGWYLLRGAARYKIFFYVGVLAWAAWIISMGWMTLTIFQNADACTLAVNEFLQAARYTDGLFEPVKTGIDAQKFMLTGGVFLFVICVLLPGIFISRKGIPNRDSEENQ